MAASQEEIYLDFGVRNMDDLTEAFIGQRSKANIQFLSMWNRNDRPLGAPRFYVKQAPMSQDDSLEYHLKVLFGRTQKDRKTLFLMPQSQIKMQLLDVQKLMGSETTPQKFPAVAAFAYAVATLNLYQRDTEAEICDRRSHSASKGRNRTTGY